MNLREFIMNFLNVSTVVNIYSRERDYDLDTPVHLEYGDTVELLLKNKQFANLLDGKVEYVAASFRNIQPIMDIHISME